MMNYFSRTAAGVFAALIVVGAIAGGTAYAGSVVKKNILIDETTAEEFAILDAGVKEEDVENLNTTLEKEDGRYVYDIRFRVGDRQYEYEISAEDGAVIEKDIDIETVGTKSVESKTADSPDPQTAAGAAGDDSGTKAPAESQDRAAGQQTDPAQQRAGSGQEQAGSYISVDRAKQIALDHAELAVEEVRFSGAKLDNDDGRAEYEIEFYCGQIEYEYDIDAITGEILESSMEYDND